MQEHHAPQESADQSRPITAPTDERRLVLHTLLDEGLALSPEYGPQLSSHLPMALEALYALGASPERMRAFSGRYTESLEPSPASTGSIVTLGEFETYASWRQEFGDRIALQGTHAVLRSALETLMAGVSAAAFHGLIRVGHAVRAGHDRELAAALAYWACRFQAVQFESGSPMALGPWLEALTEIYKKALTAGAVPKQGLISQRMAAWATRNEVQHVAPRLSPGGLSALALAAGRLYVATRNFTVLHVVTSSAALVRLRPWLNDEAVQHYVAAVGVALLASGTLGADCVDVSELPLAWDALAEAAIGHDDDHAIKLVLACQELDQSCPDALWRHVATRAVQAP